VVEEAEVIPVSSVGQVVMEMPVVVHLDGAVQPKLAKLLVAPTLEELVETMAESWAPLG
jgi:hypothetical protein